MEVRLETLVSGLGDRAVKANLTQPVATATLRAMSEPEQGPEQIAAIILAAGGSRRLGQPKQLVRVGDETLLERTIRVVREAGVDDVSVVLGAQSEVIQARVDLSEVRVIVNSEWESGIASSIRAGVGAVGAEAMAVMLLVCDQPKLMSEHVGALLDAYANARDRGIAASLYAGVAGIPAIFPASEFERLLALRGDSGARALLRDPECPLVTVPFDGGDVDVDTPADLASITSALEPDESSS